MDDAQNEPLVKKPPNVPPEDTPGSDGAPTPERTQYSAVPAGEGILPGRGMRRNLLMLLFLTFAAFVLTAWIFIRVDSPFGIFSAGPQAIVRAQLRELVLGEVRPAYELFSERYRQQVSFDMWRELIVTHWPAFHSVVLGAGTTVQTGRRVTFEVHLRGADGKDYRARFTVVRVRGRWWIDDVHWAEEPDRPGAART